MLTWFWRRCSMWFERSSESYFGWWNSPGLDPLNLCFYSCTLGCEMTCCTFSVVLGYRVLDALGTWWQKLELCASGFELVIWKIYLLRVGRRGVEVRGSYIFDSSISWKLRLKPPWNNGFIPCMLPCIKGATLHFGLNRVMPAWAIKSSAFWYNAWLWSWRNIVSPFSLSEVLVK